MNTRSKIGIGVLIFVIIAMLFVVCDSGVCSNENKILDYKGVYYDDNKTLGIRIDDKYFKYVWFDGSGVWGNYSITSQTELEVEILFGNIYDLKDGTQTRDVAYRLYTGATVKKENEQIVIYLHYKVAKGDYRLVKESNVNE